MFISTDAMIALLGTVGYATTFSNMAVKASDSLEGVVGTNVMENMVGEEGYQKIAEASQSGSEIIFMMGLMNPDLYVKDQRVTNIRQVAAYDNSEGGSESQFQKVFDLADNYTLSDDTFNNHILDRHGPNSTYGNKSHFNVDFDIREGIDSTLIGDNFVVGPNTAGREGYIFEQTFSNPIGTSSNGKPLYILKVVIDEAGNVITAFPKK